MSAAITRMMTIQMAICIVVTFMYALTDYALLACFIRSARIPGYWPCASVRTSPAATAPDTRR